MAESDFERVWNDWHTSICSTADLTAHILDQLVFLDGRPPEWLVAAAWICSQRIKDEAVNAPVPPWSKISQGNGHAG